MGILRCWGRLLVFVWGRLWFDTPGCFLGYFLCWCRAARLEMILDSVVLYLHNCGPGFISHGLSWVLSVLSSVINELLSRTVFP